ncbi:MAG: metal-dependent transcriptional regulator [Clostridiaceae bacterium]|nr:metal-dependent transcriptional regulator [Clostridiaceae bacterium]
MEMLSPNMEEYMKTIFKLHRLSGDGIVHISDIAEDRGLRKASVCRATDILAEKGFVQKDRYKGLYFTKKGLQYAYYIERRYSIITRFLNEVLRVDLDTARKDACGIEHVISDECYRSICLFLREQAVI